MSEKKLNPIANKERLVIIDVLRGLAIGGILIGNMQWFSGYGNLPTEIAAQGHLIDRVTTFLVHFSVEGKFYSIFSLLFGFGFALQIAKAEERGDQTAKLFKRRLFWLLIIGLLHAYLLWAGDILSIYALVGLLLILFRRKTKESLLKWSFWLMVIPILTYILLYVLFVSFAPPEIGSTIEKAKMDSWNDARQVVPNSSFYQIISEYNLNYMVGRYMGLILQMRLPKILAMFLLGFYFYRIGFFQNPSKHQPLIRKVLIYGLILGLVGNFTFAFMVGNEAEFPPSAAGIIGVICYGFGVPALALFYIGLIVTLWQTEFWQRILSFFAPVGRMALTNYLMQTVICVLIFYGYGFGQFGKFGAVSATLIALLIFLFQILVSAIWLKYFAFGPLEWIWRQLTYGKRLNLRINNQPHQD